MSVVTGILRFGFSILVVLLMSYTVGTWSAIKVAARAGLDGQLTRGDQEGVERAAYRGIWAVLRKFPGLQVD